MAEASAFTDLRRKLPKLGLVLAPGLQQLADLDVAPLLNQHSSPFSGFKQLFQVGPIF